MCNPMLYQLPHRPLDVSTVQATAKFLDAQILLRADFNANISVSVRFCSPPA